MSRTLIILGLILVAAGLLWPMIGKLGLGRLPGDIHIEGANYSFYFPAHDLAPGQRRAQRHPVDRQSINRL